MRVVNDEIKGSFRMNVVFIRPNGTRIANSFTSKTWVSSTTSLKTIIHRIIRRGSLEIPKTYRIKAVVCGRMIKKLLKT